MDETIGMLSVTAALVLGIWLVDYSGDVSRASVTVRSASHEAGEYAAAALAAPPATVTDAQLDRRATEISEQVVSAAAIGNCNVADQRFAVDAEVHRLSAKGQPAAVTVEATCPLSVSPLFRGTVSSRVAVPVPDALRTRP